MSSGFLLTKILATMGPAISKESTVISLLKAGVRCFRINFSHGTFAEHRRSLAMIRKAAAKTDIPVGILGDLCGPKIRVGEVPETGVKLAPGMKVEFRKPEYSGPDLRGGQEQVTALPTTFPLLIDEVRAGDRVLLDDGRVKLDCRKKPGLGETDTLVCKVIRGGTITSGKGINLPDTRLSVSALTEKDRECVRFAVENEFDFLALSFVRKAEDVRHLRSYLSDLEGGANLPVICKIEKPEALEEIEAIIDESDGIMVARGDLGVEMDLAEVPIVQKKMIALCQDYGKPVIVATQMLETMIDSPTPTRAEVSDIANAIFDGTDVVMLSGETAIGRWPVESVRVMNRVSVRTNAFLKNQPPHIAAPRRLQESKNREAALAHGMSTIVRDLDAKLIVLWADSDRSGLYLSRYHLSRPILAFSGEPAALRRMCIGYGLTPMYMEKPGSTGDFIQKVDALLVENRWVNKGDPVVFVSGEPIGQTDITNKLVIHYVGEAGEQGRDKTVSL